MGSNRPPRTAPNRGIRAKLVEYFIKNQGVPVFLKDIREFTGATSDVAVQNAISNLRGEGDWESKIMIQAAGRVWVYRDIPMPTGKRLFEELAVTKTGDIIIQDNDGKVYRAVEL